MESSVALSTLSAILTTCDAKAGPRESLNAISRGPRFIDFPLKFEFSRDAKEQCLFDFETDHLRVINPMDFRVGAMERT
jgi:hypothetical protein